MSLDPAIPNIIHGSARCSECETRHLTRCKEIPCLRRNSRRMQFIHSDTDYLYRDWRKREAKYNRLKNAFLYEYRSLFSQTMQKYHHFIIRDISLKNIHKPEENIPMYTYSRKWTYKRCTSYFLNQVAYLHNTSIGKPITHNRDDSTSITIRYTYRNKDNFLLAILYLTSQP